MPRLKVSVVDATPRGWDVVCNCCNYVYRAMVKVDAQDHARWHRQAHRTHRA